MNGHADIACEQNILSLSGDLNFLNVMSVYQKSLAFLSRCPALTFDFSQVSSSDSSGLALMIEWIKYTRHHRTQITFKNIPEQLLNLAKLSGFDKTNHFAAQIAGDQNLAPLPYKETN